MNINFDTSGFNAIAQQMQQQQMAQRPQASSWPNFGVQDYFQGLGMSKNSASALSSGLGWGAGLGLLGAITGGGQGGLQGLGMGLLGGAAGDWLRSHRKHDDNNNNVGKRGNSGLLDLIDLTKPSQPDFGLLPQHTPTASGVAYQSLPLPLRRKI